MVGYAQGNNADLQKSRIKKDERDVREMTNLLLNSWLNPFSDGSQPLASISTSAIPPPVIAQDLARAYQAGETAFQDLRIIALNLTSHWQSSTTPSRSRS